MHFFVDANPKNHEILGYTERGKVSLALAAITFDVSIMEEFIPLAHGLTICMANEDEIHNPLIPNSNVQVVMTDEKNRPLPIGALGEMTILGDGIGRGYVNRDDLTQKVFIKLWNRPAYKSGDLARLLPNGEIAFHGRTDNQVKLRGLRVELGEIETVMNNFDGVKASIVVVKKNSAGDYLAGYFTAEKKIDLDELRKHLAASLTAYMVPGVLMQLDAFPLTANRKIDKKALPEPTKYFGENFLLYPQ